MVLEWFCDVNLVVWRVVWRVVLECFCDVNLVVWGVWKGASRATKRRRERDETSGALAKLLYRVAGGGQQVGGSR